MSDSDNDLEFLLEELPEIESVDGPATIKFIPHPPTKSKSPAQTLNGHPKTKFTIIPSQSSDNLYYVDNDVLDFENNSFDSSNNSSSSNSPNYKNMNIENSSNNYQSKTSNSNSLISEKDPLSPNTFDSSDDHLIETLEQMFNDNKTPIKSITKEFSPIHPLTKSNYDYASNSNLQPNDSDSILSTTSNTITYGYKSLNSTKYGNNNNDEIFPPSLEVLATSSSDNNSTCGNCDSSNDGLFSPTTTDGIFLINYLIKNRLFFLYI